MPKCTMEQFEFPGLKRRQIISQMSGRAITSAAGGKLLQPIVLRLHLGPVSGLHYYINKGQIDFRLFSGYLA